MGVTCRLDVLARFWSISIIQRKKLPRKTGKKIARKTEIITLKIRPTNKLLRKTVFFIQVNAICFRSVVLYLEVKIKLHVLLFCVGGETHCVSVWLLQPLVSRVQSLQGALDLCSSFCSAAQRVCDLQSVGDTFMKTKVQHSRVLCTDVNCAALFLPRLLLFCDKVVINQGVFLWSEYFYFYSTTFI